MYEKILKLLKEKDESLLISDLCEATGISQPILSNLKSRGGKLSLDNAVAVASYLGVSVEALLEE